LKPKIIPVIRTIGYIIGLLLLLFQAYEGVIAIKQGKAIIPGAEASLFALITAIIALACQIIAWWLIMKGMSVNHIPLKKVFWGYTLSFLPRYIPGSVWGYLSRGNWLKTEYNVDYQISTSGSVIELVLMVLVNTILGASIFIRYLDVKYIYALILIILIVALILYFYRNLKNIFLYILRKVRWVYILVSVLLLFLTWIFYGIGLFIITGANSANPSYGIENILLFIAIYSTAWLVGFLIVFVPAGMGVRELALSYLLVTYIHLDPLTANGISIFYRLIISLSEISWLVLGFGIKQLGSLKSTSTP
jgi:glycosyltransferase 2 family protein